jgi:TatD-related deoxyribonuclease
VTNLDTPVLDDHLHLDPERGRGLDAVREFSRLGGTHLLVVNKPSWHVAGVPEGREGFRSAFEATLSAVEAANDVLDGAAWAVLGVHPGLISKLTEQGLTPAEAGECMRAGVDLAAEYVADGDALALKSGRPHYEVDAATWTASNETMRHAFARASELDCAVQLHTEAAEDLTEVADWARAAGLDPDSVVKHYAGGRLDGPIPSVMSDRDRLERAAERAAPFLMETDFVDDPDRPGAVLGPKTVPRRVRWLLSEGHERAVEIAHVETPKLAYGIDTEATLDAE